MNINQYFNKTILTNLTSFLINQTLIQYIKTNEVFSLFKFQLAGYGA